MKMNCLLYAVLAALLIESGCKSAGTQNEVGTSGEKNAAAASSKEGDGVFKAGEAAPEIKLTSLAGKPVSLQDFRGKTVLLNFWATWCVPCVAEMPALERLYKTYKDRNFEIVSVNVDAVDNEAGVKKFIADTGISFSVLRDPDSTIPPQYGLTGFPESFLLDKDGKFMKFADPSAGETGVRVVGDRPWDSKAMVKAIGELLGAQSK